MSDKAHQLPAAQAPLGDFLDTELLTVNGESVLRQRLQNCGKGEGADDIQEGGIVALGIAQYGLGVRVIPGRSTLQTLVSAVVFDDVKVQDLGALEIDCGPYSKAILYLDLVISAGAPTGIRIGLEFADDFSSPVDADFHLLTADRVNITDFAIQRTAIIIPASGRLVRSRLDADGTTASDTITATVTAEFFNE